MIKAVLFDFGGVLSEAGKRGSVRHIFGELYGTDLDVMKIDDLQYKMWRGQISDDEFFAEVAKRYPDAPVATKDDYLWASRSFARAEPVYVLAKQLRAVGIRTGVLSNIYGLVAERLQAKGFYDGFDPVILSSNEGMAKPDEGFYRLALERLGLNAHEVLFIDDQPYCLEPAKAMGMKTLLAVSSTQVVNDTKALFRAENRLEIPT